MNATLLLALAGFLIAAFNAALALRNLRLYRRAVPAELFDDADRAALDAARLAVCIPARDEEANIERCVRAALASDVPDLRVLVYDDASSDRTPDILANLAAEDPRVILPERRELPPGWNGKQHGCSRCAHAAFALTDDFADAPSEDPPNGPGSWTATHVLFIDADVRLAPDAAPRALVEFDRRARPGVGLTVKDARGFGLLSTFPRQITGSLAEATIVPMIFFLLLSYLPMKRMRTTLDPAASAACGQFIMVSRDAYAAARGHESFKDSMHDGIKMPRAVRRAGYRTDIYDASDSASVRMYRGLDETWRGFTKNAFEGLGSVALLVFLTVMNVVGHIVPPVLLIALLLDSALFDASVQALPFFVALAATVVPIVHRVAIADRLGHRAIGALVHPVGVAMMIAIQWHSFVLHTTGNRTWRGRTASVQERKGPQPAAQGG
jgi:glycosyltransferase involved in cell wall biosynthesis